MATVKYTGPIASFHCPTNADIRSLKVHFSPKQLGEGDPSPENVREIVGWEGVEATKCGKNLFNPATVTMNFEIGSDGNPLATGNTNRWCITDFIPVKPNTTYIAKSLLTQGSGRSAVYNVNKEKVSAKMETVGVNAETIITTGSTGCYVRLTIRIADGLDTIFKEGTNTTSYEPYQGSTTNYEFGVLGKNKCPAENGTEIGQNWEYDQYNHYINISGLQPNHQYTLQCTITKVLTEGSQNRFYLVSRNGSSFINLAKSEVPVMASITRYSNDDGTIRIQLNNSFSLDAERAPYLTNIQLELGSSATAYEPYDPNHTIYGGWVDLISGEAKEEGIAGYPYEAIILNGTENWSIVKQDNQTTIFKFDYGSKAKTESNSICSHFKMGLASYNSFGYINGFVHGMSGNLFIQPSNAIASTIEDFKAYLAEQYQNNSPVTVLFQANRTPNTYHLAPTQLQTFLGQNNVWSTADYVEVEYDLHETEDILRRKQFIIANQPHLVTPVAASLQNFKTDVIAPLKECKVHFSPVQDLHGYSKPWPAGGGKNIAKPYDNSYVSSTYVSFDYSAANGTFRCYGTASASSTHSSPSATNAVNNGAAFTLPAGTYTLSIIDGDGANIYAQCVSSTETVLAETTTYTTFTTNESLTVFVRLKVAAAATVDKTVKIQLEKGSSATAYEPYENLCPISGWTGVDVYRTGKNLFDESRFALVSFNLVTDPENDNYGYYYGRARNLGYLSTVAFNISNGGFVGKNTTGVITFSCDVRDVGSRFYVRFFYDDGTTSGTTHVYSSGYEGHISLSSLASKNCIGVNIQTIGGANSYIAIKNVQIEFGTTENTYAQFGSTIPVSWETEAGTVHGGYVDLVTGDVWKNFELIDMGNLNWSIVNGRFYASVADIQIGDGNSYMSTAKCDIYETITYNDIIRNGAVGIAVNNTAFIRAYNPDYATVVDFVTAVTGHKIAYPLVEPVKVGAIDPITLKTLRGTNNIWASNGGDSIEITYWKH